uniref:Uncharacterized protein n=1 Tax=Aegilops tauschii TaxID=37682 RepID=R7WA12_AEGTA
MRLFPATSAAAATKTPARPASSAAAAATAKFVSRARFPHASENSEPNIVASPPSTTRGCSLSDFLGPGDDGVLLHEREPGVLDADGETGNNRITNNTSK